MSVALITGGAVRIGAEISRHFVANGWKVAVHYRNSRAEAEALRQELSADNCAIFQADLTNEAQREKLLPQVISHFGRLDCLINNASTYKRASLRELQKADFAEAYRINCLAPLALMQQFARETTDGSIINLLDCRVNSVDPDCGAYLLAKKSLRDLTLALALELAPAFRVNGVAPGLVMSPAGVSPDKIARLAQHVPLRRTVSPSDLSAACLFLAQCASVTGVILPVDGGSTLQGSIWQEKKP